MISAIITAHDEPLHMIRRAIGSALQGAYEVLVVMPEKRGAEARRLEAEHSKARAVLTHRRGVAAKRNAGVLEARQEFVAFLDADDLFGHDWLLSALREAEQHEGDVVVHPQVSIYFGDEAPWFQHVDQRSKAFDPWLFFDNNYWTSHFLARRETLKKWPMPDDYPGFALEDWAWHRNSVALGALHVVAEKTVTFVRKRRGSRNAQAAAQKLLPLLGEYLATREWSLHPKTATEDRPHEDLAHADWLLSAWRRMNTREPELWPAPKLTAKSALFEPASAGAGQSIARVIEALRPYDRLILTPWLTHGGADLQVLAHAEAVEAAHPGKCAIVLTDPKALAPPAGAPVPVVRLREHVEPAHAPLALLYALVSRARSSLHIVNSELGYVLMREHGAAIKQHIQRAFASLFCVDYSPPSQRRGGYAFDGTFTRCAEHFDRVLTDNSHVVRELKQIGVVDVSVAKLPIAQREPRTPRAPADAPVLWASRLDAQKGVALLRTIAADNPSRTFCVVGASMMQATPDVREAIEALERLPNVLLDKRAWAHTPESLARLFDPARYACLLYTGQWDGTPNVVLEALAHGLPVVSTVVGDVEAYTPFIVAEQDDKDTWRDMLALASACPSEIALAAVAKHTPARFEAVLREAEYL